MNDKVTEEKAKAKLIEICKKIKKTGGLKKFPKSFLNKITDFGGSPRRHQILIDFLAREGIDVTKSRSVFGFPERRDVYRALAELVTCERFADIFLKLKLLNSFSKRPKTSRIRILEERMDPAELSEIRKRSVDIQKLLKSKFLEVFDSKILTEFKIKKVPEGEPEVYCSESNFQGNDYFIITFDFPREQRMSLWKHEKDILRVPDYLTVWIDLKDGCLTVSESSLNHRIFHDLEGILKDVLKLSSLDVVKHSPESSEVLKAIEQGLSGAKPVRQIELAGKDDRKIQKIVISGESVLEKLQEVIGKVALQKMLKLFDIRYVQGESDYVID
ncbi:MAG: hypothetical protein KAR39_06770 [Thermoplasmata archaeon]|nr:hypothetical protein [Thermoplasmata archaeon]